MEIVQKKNSTKHTVKFYDDHFNFAYEDKTGSGDTDINYADFPQKSSIQIEQNEWLRNVGALWCALGILQIGFAVYSEAWAWGKGFWLILGLACMAWAYISKIKYSVFKAEHGNVFIIQDKNHDTIIGELNSRRKKQLLSWCGDIDPENTIDNEIKKFKWLAEQDVISKEESDRKIAQAKLLYQDSYVLPGERLN